MLDFLQHAPFLPRVPCIVLHAIDGDIHGELIDVMSRVLSLAELVDGSMRRLEIRELDVADQGSDEVGHAIEACR